MRENENRNIDAPEVADVAAYGNASYIRTETESNKSLGLGAVLVVFLIALLVAIWVFGGVAGAQTREQGAVTIKQTIQHAAMQCFAIEGAYPPSVRYLEENYGLSINERDYTVRYEVFASNVLPSIVVTPK